MFSRRHFLQNTASGFGWLAFAGLATAATAEKRSPLAPRGTHFPPRARRVIFLCMTGAPSHLDLLDYKPRLIADSGKSAPQGRPGGARLMGSPWHFAQHGHSGQWISELLPNLARHADDLCVIRSMQTGQPAHAPASVELHTGSAQFIRPSLGAWSLYGLGSENENLPGFITLAPPGGNGGAQNYGSSFLPAIYQGTRIGAGGLGGRQTGEMKLGNVANPRLTPAQQRSQLDFLQSLNKNRLARDRFNPQIEGAIDSFELAFKMQSEVPALMDLSREPDSVKKAYGVGVEPTDSFAKKCLLARRFAEAGVRFIEVSHGDWDHHRNLKEALPASCAQIDQPVGALLADLKSRGLLEDTLVIWGGEFGRTPHAQNADGRDHNNKGFSLWMAGGGVKPGTSYGSTDDYGYEAVENPVPIHDWHATILHLLGLDHERLTYRYAGRDFRLTDVKGQVVQGVLG